MISNEFEGTTKKVRDTNNERARPKESSHGRDALVAHGEVKHTSHCRQKTAMSKLH